MHIMADVYKDRFKSFDDVKAALSYDQYKEVSVNFKYLQEYET